MSLFEVRHHCRAQAALQKARDCGRMPHAYIFHGPAGVGKGMLAQRLAQLLQCHNPTNATDLPEEYARHNSSWVDACGNCAACELAAGSDGHPDCHFIRRTLIKFHPDATVRGRKGLDLGVDVIRHFVIDAAGRKAVHGRAKVFIIEEAELLTPSAQNALLKTIEEPPPQTYIILLTNSLLNLLETTRSRCASIGFGLLPRDFVASQLQILRPDSTAEEQAFFASHEPGSLGRALQLIDDGFYAVNEVVTQALLQLSRQDTLTTAHSLEDTAKKHTKQIKAREPDATESDVLRRALRATMGLMSSLYRDILHAGVQSGVPLANAALDRELSKLSQRLNPESIQMALQSVHAAERQLHLNVNPRLCLENLVIRLARVHAD